MTLKQIALQYISALEKGDVDLIISLFSENGIVESPLYGTKQSFCFFILL